MEGYLDRSKINYVLYHFQLLYDFDGDIRKRIIFLKDPEDIKSHKSKIIFILSKKGQDFNPIKKKCEIPILFPLSEEKGFYNFYNDNLIFKDDLLKSAFYLLSGYQEYVSNKKDFLNRFPYDYSVQKKLDIILKPVVNYYFQEIYEGLKRFCAKTNLRIQKRNWFNNFGFMLTHDIDRLDYYDIYYIGYKLKELLGLVESRYSRINTLKLLITGIFQYLNFINRKNPYWDFDFLRRIEKECNFRSVFYFLQKDQKHVDAYFDIEEPRIKNLIHNLVDQECEIGLHGTVSTSTSYEKMFENLKKLSAVYSQKIEGIRQHRLAFEHPKTFLFQKEVGLKYDTSLGFAAHEGFRNSFCFPFKPYDFEKKEMIDIWEIPLNVMDSTLLDYRGLSFPEAFSSIKSIIGEIKKFNGIFTLLWHNGYFDELRFEGIKSFYINMIREIKKDEPESILGKEIVQRFNSITKAL